MFDKEAEEYATRECCTTCRNINHFCKELVHWIREKPTREWKYKNGVTVYGYYGYEEKCENEEVPNNILIRENGGEWKEPLVEVEE